MVSEDSGLGSPSALTSGTRVVDWVRRPASVLLGWGIPTLAAAVVGSLPVPLWTVTVTWTLAFVWMGTGCLLNARRCRRRHCYISGPVLLFGAFTIALVGFDVTPLGSDTAVTVGWATLGVVLLTFVPERIWGKYVSG